MAKPGSLNSKFNRPLLGIMMRQMCTGAFHVVDCFLADGNRVALSVDDAGADLGSFRNF